MHRTCLRLIYSLIAIRNQMVIPIRAINNKPFGFNSIYIYIVMSLNLTFITTKKRIN